MLTSPKILLVEDDRFIANTLAMALQSSYKIDVSHTGKQALYKADIYKYDLVLLDPNLPDMSGLDICQQLRQRGIQAPIFILSAEDKVLTKIDLLDAGANDYLTKPFSLGELKARMRVLLRQKPDKPIWPNSILSVSDVVLDRKSFVVTRDNRRLDLRRKEFEILQCLMESAGQIVSRKQLTDYVWNGGIEPWANTLDVHIKHLRDKLDKPFNTPLLKTVHGRGYMLETVRDQAKMIPNL
jgi:two-component system OmpR family response regulator